MYLPYEIWDEVYYYSESWKLIKSKITRFIIDKENVIVDTELWMEKSFSIHISCIYPTKAVAKEELLRRAINYANETLIDM